MGVFLRGMVAWIGAVWLFKGGFGVVFGAFARRATLFRLLFLKAPMGPCLGLLGPEGKPTGRDGWLVSRWGKGFGCWGLA